MMGEFAYRKIEMEESASAESGRLLEQLLGLSKAWADEKCCPAYDPNDESEFRGKSIYAAFDGQNMIAFAMGHEKVLEEKTSYNSIGERAFELDEIYVSKEYRNRGVGKALYAFLEADVKDKVDLIALIAISYRYKELLDLYIDELGFDFRYALLVKRTGEPFFG